MSSRVGTSKSADRIYRKLQQTWFWFGVFARRFRDLATAMEWLKAVVRPVHLSNNLNHREALGLEGLQWSERDHAVV